MKHAVEMLESEREHLLRRIAEEQKELARYEENVAGSCNRIAAAERGVADVEAALARLVEQD